MYQKLRSRLDRKDESGFTLIELLMVIVILAVLAAVVVFSVGGINDTSKTSACDAQVSTINTAAEAYYAQNGSAVGGIQELITAKLLHGVPSGATVSAAGSNPSTLTASGYTVTFDNTVGSAGSVTSTCP